MKQKVLNSVKNSRRNDKIEVKIINNKLKAENKTLLNHGVMIRGIFNSLPEDIQAKIYADEEPERPVYRLVRP